MEVSGQGMGESSKLVDLVPKVDRSGWKVAEEIAEYSPESLYEYLNGGAPQYLSYGFVQLISTRWSYRGDDLRSVTLDLYAMQSPLGAYGIYSSGRPRSASVREWGAEGYRSGTIAAAWKGDVYVHGSADENDPVLIEFLEHVIARAVNAVPGEPQLPWIVKALPSANRVPFSDRFVGKDLFGHSFLPGGVIAEYRLGEGFEGLLFISDLATDEKAKEARDRLVQYEEERGSIVAESQIGGTKLIWVEDPGLGSGAFSQFERFVFGLWGSPESPATRTLLKKLIQNLEEE
jgi:hypothetical protein